jgi:Nif-specific regulatory protein
MEELRQVSSSNATVLIRGESGTGKELVAGLIHANSPRVGRPFIKVNCAALPEGLVESELFGSERGAFTGSIASRKGRFEMAQGGTLFLDEVADMTTLTQSKLLRAIQEKEFERVGGSETIRVDVRLIAATNRNLEEMVSAGLFRQDLYYRLSVFPIILPPLRRRRDDIMPLAVHFIDKISEINHKKIMRIAPGAITMLMQYDWPGNIRELENVIERAIILSGAEGVIDCRHLPVWLQPGSAANATDYPQTAAPAEERKKHAAGASMADGHATEEQRGRETAGHFISKDNATLEEALNALEKRMIMESLEESGGNMAKAARKLDITERIMGLRMKKYSLDYRYFRKGEGTLLESVPPG